MAYKNFKELRVWREARALAVAVYAISAEGDLAKDFQLANQMRKAAISVASNIAEGHERGHRREFIRFLRIAQGSLSELRTQLDIAYSIGSLTLEDFDRLEELCVYVGRMLTRLMARQYG